MRTREKISTLPKIDTVCFLFASCNYLLECGYPTSFKPTNHVESTMARHNLFIGFQHSQQRFSREKLINVYLPVLCLQAIARKGIC